MDRRKVALLYPQISSKGRAVERQSRNNQEIIIHYGTTA